jgi:hypothetical protein
MESPSLRQKLIHTSTRTTPIPKITTKAFGVGLRAFSKALVVILGMGVVLVEVCISFCRRLGLLDAAY